MASTLGTELLLLLVSVSIGHCSNVCLSHLINGPTINAMDTNSAHYNLTLITTLGFIATVVMAVLNITPTMDFTRKHLLYRHDHPLYPSSVFQRVICTLFYVQSCVILMHRVRVNLKPLRMMNVNNDLSNVNTRNTSLLENYLKPQNVLFVQAIPTVMHTNAINTLNALNTHGITLRPSFSIPRAHSYLILRAILRVLIFNFCLSFIFVGVHSFGHVLCP
eukprot:697293_1